MIEGVHVVRSNTNTGGNISQDCPTLGSVIKPEKALTIRTALITANIVAVVSESDRSLQIG